jgi:hypothetical protein
MIWTVRQARLVAGRCTEERQATEEEDHHDDTREVAAWTHSMQQLVIRAGHDPSSSYTHARAHAKIHIGAEMSPPAWRGLVEVVEHSGRRIALTCRVVDRNLCGARANAQDERSGVRWVSVRAFEWVIHSLPQSLRLSASARTRGKYCLIYSSLLASPSRTRLLVDGRREKRTMFASARRGSTRSRSYSGTGQAIKGARRGVDDSTVVQQTRAL